jgi:hypothetical protein
MKKLTIIAIVFISTIVVSSAQSRSAENLTSRKVNVQRIDNTQSIQLESKQKLTDAEIDEKIKTLEEEKAKNKHLDGFNPDAYDRRIDYLKSIKSDNNTKKQ